MPESIHTKDESKSGTGVLVKLLVLENEFWHKTELQIFMSFRHVLFHAKNNFLIVAGGPFYHI